MLPASLARREKLRFKTRPYESAPYTTGCIRHAHHTVLRSASAWLNLFPEHGHFPVLAPWLRTPAHPSWKGLTGPLIWPKHCVNVEKISQGETMA